MADIIRGKVKRIVSGDTFEMEVTEVIAGDPDHYDENERVTVASLDDEIVSRTNELEEGEPIDEEETSGTPEEASIETGRVDSSRFFGVMSAEDLEIHVGGSEVECTVHERDHLGNLVADVTVLNPTD